MTQVMHKHNVLLDRAETVPERCISKKMSEQYAIIHSSFSILEVASAIR
jgi:hypothetical protein